MEEKKEIKPEVPVQLVQGKPAEEKKETAVAETKPATAPLLTKEALRMVHALLGRSFIREHPEEWAILKNQLKNEVRPVPAENKALMDAIDDFQAERRLRKERYDALPKCAKCGGAGRLGHHVDEESGEISQYHIQCAGDNKRLTSYQNAQKISEAVKKRIKEEKSYSASILNNTLKGILATSQVENKKRAEDKEDARKITEKKDALKVAGRIAANSISSKKNSNQTLIGKAMASAAIAKEKTTK